jgi:hypothetical protein
LFLDWQKAETLEFNRPDLHEYCSSSYFIDELNKILD